MVKSLVLRILAVVSGFLGMAILSYTLYPLARYELYAQERYSPLLSPIPDSERMPDVSSEYDLTLASNWFPGGAKHEEFVTSKVNYYSISIPKLKINKKTVSIGGEDLAQSLIQYPGTALPGKKGNTVIFGHSILPIFYDPDNYLAIFSTLPSLIKGDKIEVDYDGISYIYRVSDMFEVEPSALEVLEQGDSTEVLSLITCVPPGHPLKPRRLIVRAKLSPLEK